MKGVQRNVLVMYSENRPCHGFRPPFCWVGKEIKERLPSARSGVNGMFSKISAAPCKQAISEP